MSTKPNVKRIRTDAGVSRKVAAEAASISQFKLDKIERDAPGVTDEDRKAYHDALVAFVKTVPVKVKVEAKPAKVVVAKKTAPAKKAAAKPRSRTARKSTQAKADPKPQPKADEPKAEWRHEQAHAARPAA